MEKCAAAFEVWEDLAGPNEGDREEAWKYRETVGCSVGDRRRETEREMREGKRREREERRQGERREKRERREKKRGTMRKRNKEKAKGGQKERQWLHFLLQLYSLTL